LFGLRNEPGTHGIWELPDGRKLFYPFGYGNYAYVLQNQSQERRIRFRYRFLQAALWFPGVFAIASEDWRIVVVYVLSALLFQFVVARLAVRDMPRVREPMWMLRSFRLHADSRPRGAIALGFFICVGMLAVTAWVATTRGDNLWISTAAALFFGYLTFQCVYMWYAKAA
jgi:hypothetical protein